MTARHIEDLIDLLNTRGGSAYFGEPVSILEHSLQAAHSAEVSSAGPAAISAALLVVKPSRSAGIRQAATF